jgi:hypothetical protein
MAKGGKRDGAGRPSKVDEEKMNSIFLRAVKEITKKDNDDEARIAYLKRIAQHERGEMFIANHLYGKPKEKVEIDSKSPIVIDMSSWK